MGEGVGAQPKPPCGRFLRPSAAAAAPPPGAAPRSLPLFHTLPGRPACRAGVKPQTGKKGRAGKGQPFPPREPGREPGHRAAGPAAPSAPPTQAKPACPGCAGVACGPPSPVSLSLHTSPAQTSPRYHQILPNPPPSPGKIPPRPRKKAPPPSGRRFAHIFRFSPAWPGRHGCGRGSPHGPAPPPALCRRRG